MKTVGFKVEGTTCESCSKIVKKQAMKVDGVERVSFDYATESGKVRFDPAKTDIDEILDKIEEKGYSCFILDAEGPVKSGGKAGNVLAWVFALLGIVVAGYFLLGFVEGIGLPEISQNMGYGLLFVVGLLTGFHCIAMCGGFVVGYTAKDAQAGRGSHKSHIMYGAGKTVSYTVIGAGFGLLGSLIAFTPRFVSRFVGKKSGGGSPLVIGLLNGLMIACGPLQAIYIMAAGTGSWLEGAKLLFVFALGTLPVMLGFGYFASFVSNKMTHKILKASGVLVIILGIVMLNRGLALTGSGYDMNSLLSGSVALESGTASEKVPLMNDGYQEIRMTVTRSGWSPDTFVLQKGVPVRWVIDGQEITGCNNAIQVPKYGLEFDIKKGEQVIEFTPDEEGTVSWSCWMGMIPGKFIVKDDIDINDDVRGNALCKLRSYDRES
ncbi:sulfite exporter TauE/SafE family protein, partial [Nanoarchaeota archaeon]